MTSRVAFMPDSDGQKTRAWEDNAARRRDFPQREAKAPPFGKGALRKGGAATRPVPAAIGQVGRHGLGPVYMSRAGPGRLPVYRVPTNQRNGMKAFL